MIRGRTPARPWRVLHVHIALYQPHLMVKALRLMGHEAESVVFADESIRWLIHDADHFIPSRFRPRELAALGRLLAGSLARFDVFHFHSLPGFIPLGWNRPLDALVGLDLRLLRMMGKAIVISHWGCHDGRTPSSFGRYEGNLACSECNHYNGLCTDEYVRTKNRPQRTAHLIINHDPDFEEFNRDAVFMHGLIDCGFWRPDEPIPPEHRVARRSREEILVFHGFANIEGRGGFARNIKGSRYIKEAVDRLAAEGWPVRLMNFHRTPNRELKYYQLQADIIVDQLFYGWIGSAAREGLALGKPVITYVRPEWLRNHGAELPVISADKDTIYDALKDLLVHPERLAELGRQARRFAERELDLGPQGRRLDEFYRRAAGAGGRG